MNLFPLGHTDRPSCFTEEEWRHYLTTREDGQLTLVRASNTIFCVRHNTHYSLQYLTAEEVLTLLSALPPRVPAERMPRIIHSASPSEIDLSTFLAEL